MHDDLVEALEESKFLDALVLLGQNIEDINTAEGSQIKFLLVEL